MIAGLLLNHYDWQPLRIYDIASTVISEDTQVPHTQMFSAEFNVAIESTIWVILMMQLVYVLVFGTDQIAVQRLMAADTGRNMFKAMVGHACINVLFMVLTVTVSWGFVAYYHENVAARQALEHPDQVLAHYAVNYVPFLVRGIIMAGLLAAMMSSFDSALNSMANVTINEFYKRFVASDRSEREYAVMARIFTLGWGVALLGFAIWQYYNSQSTVAERLGRLNNLLLAPLPCFFLTVQLQKARVGRTSTRSPPAPADCVNHDGHYFVAGTSGSRLARLIKLCEPA